MSGRSKGESEGEGDEERGDNVLVLMLVRDVSERGSKAGLEGTDDEAEFGDPEVEEEGEETMEKSSLNWGNDTGFVQY